jgi:ABC-type nickel/cobalt efflux system permease component RcnA
MHSIYFIVIVVAVLLVGSIAFGRDTNMPASTRSVLIGSGILIVVLTVWLSMRPGP